MSALSNTWYHATTSRNWLEEVIDGNIVVHIGSTESALDRADLLLEHTDEVVIYEIEINPRARVFAEYAIDENEWPEHISQFRAIYGGEKQGSFKPYVNKYEAPGEISLLGIPANLVHVQTLILDEIGGEPTVLN